MSRMAPKKAKGEPPEVKQRRIPSEKELANLKPFQPGQSGNPSGRPKGTTIMTDAYFRALSKKIANDKEGRTYADAVAEKLMALMLKGDVRCASEVTDRLQGKAPQALALGGDGSGVPIEIAGMTPEEKRRRLAEIMAKARGTD
jgi:Family of unknown function (DUF5681)